MIMDMEYSYEEAHSARFQQVLERLKQEHVALKRELEHVQELTGHMAAKLGTEEARKLLREIKQEMETLLCKLEEHEEWEEAEVLPVLAGYASQGLEPSFLTSAWVLEEEHKQTERFVRSFLAYAEQCETASLPKLKKAVSLLCVACSVVEDHLLAEEETVLPVAEEILNECQDE
ncbi:hemerythrin domain-containing protein [Paenibacillus hexagrammi]|uniref:Hemerythrin domain-containing protein n=1 Tax=Paenibacillus hexagrammi TaxID=2908839 RepID=A0ABY3SL30_9BACL|nr:hemerythrin domain-containing protein [Paenibacillus sp. YPD9-1]UJF33835.1 hemerythrin domain-containing protein [Paenibacillus sp. YPD9-1]